MIGWIENKGVMPVPKGTLVDVVHRDGDVFERIKAGENQAQDWSFDPLFEDGDIIKWRRSEPRKIHVCTTCGSPRVLADAYAALNTDEVRTYDQRYCDDCEGECRTTMVEVPNDFDLETDFYKETK